MISSSLILKRSATASVRRLSRRRGYPFSNSDLARRTLVSACTSSWSTDDFRRARDDEAERYQPLKSSFRLGSIHDNDQQFHASRTGISAVLDDPNRLAHLELASTTNSASSSIDKFTRTWHPASVSSFESGRVTDFHESPKRMHPPSLAMKQLLYTSTMRAVGSNSDLSPAFQKTMRAVVQRACFSTKPSDSTESSSSSTASAVVTPATSSSSTSAQASSFSTSTASPPGDDKKSMLERGRDMVTHTITAIVSFFLKLPGNMWFYLTHPSELRNRLIELRDAAKKEAHHYWMGSKLLVADVQTAYKLLTRTLQGSPLTRRERKQLLRTVSDLFRLVPFSMFVLIPFMEFALPFALRLFPNMLPSTFQDSLKAEESMKRELKSRIAMAQFFQETLQDLVKEQKKHAERRLEKSDGSEDCMAAAAKQEESAGSMLAFLEQARSGEIVQPDVLINFATHFHDELTLDNMPRMQLINMCKYMSIPPYGADSFLRFQLRHRIRTLKEDDQRILWEGIDSLTKMELREACQERGMRSTGLSKDAYKHALQQWLDLSVNKNVPIALLIMSRTFYLREEMTRVSKGEDDTAKSLAGLADAISGLDKDVVNEVVLEVATSREKSSDPEVMKIRLEVLEQQNERIREEQEAREAASKLKKEHQEKEREQKEKLSEHAAEEPQLIDIKSPQESRHDEPATEVLSGISETVKTGGEKVIKESERAQPEISEEEAEDKEYHEEEKELSTQEMEAISQLINPDPVNKEREELERIKAAMKGDEEAPADIVAENGHAQSDSAPLAEAESAKEVLPVTEEPEPEPEPAAGAPEAFEEEKYAADTIAKLEAVVEKESKDATKHSLGEALAVQVLDEEESDSHKGFDKAIDRLKSKIESMVDKIEHQLTDVQGKIGDKLHFLDKDMDGMLSREEMALCLQQVLKRDLSFDEAMEIAGEIDENKDGLFTVAEFVQWVETNRLVKYAEEGRDLDRELDNVTSNSQKEEKKSQSPPEQ